MLSFEVAVTVFIAVLTSFAFSIMQSVIVSRVGSDHAVHAFLRDGIRANNGRLFVRVPRLLNEAYCAALPLYLHWVLARLPVGCIYWSERLLNPVLNAVHTLIVAVIAVVALPENSLIHAGHVALLFALTPQFFHALSARNFGLSARGTGLLLMTIFFAVIQASECNPWWWVALVLIGWLLWGFSTFAQQALVFLSVILLVAGEWKVLAGCLIGLMLFVAIHPQYGTSYVWHTFRFLRAYAKELAPVYIIQRRPSIWRDLVWDIWKKPSAIGIQKTCFYIYENSIVLVFFLNPLVIVSVAYWMGCQISLPGWLRFSGLLAAAGLLLMILTSFKPTRFLGEPERYVEVVTPWCTLIGALGVGALFGKVGVWILVFVFFLINLVQVGISWKLSRYSSSKNIELDDIAAAAEGGLGNNVRFCCNNEQLTKLLMGHPWQFSYFIAVGQDYAGMAANDAFTRFPFLQKGACERIVRAYHVNCLLIDRQVFESVFDAPPPELVNVKVLYQSQRFKLLQLDWDHDKFEMAAANAVV